MFTYIPLKKRIPEDHPLRPIRAMVDSRRQKRVEEVFGWMKTVRGLRKTRYRGLPRVT
jgi:hypothetical protein